MTLVPSKVCATVGNTKPAFISSLDKIGYPWKGWVEFSKYFWMTYLSRAQSYECHSASCCQTHGNGHPAQTSGNKTNSSWSWFRSHTSLPATFVDDDETKEVEKIVETEFPLIWGSKRHVAWVCEERSLFPAIYQFIHSCCISKRIGLIARWVEINNNLENDDEGEETHGV